MVKCIIEHKEKLNKINKSLVLTLAHYYSDLKKGDFCEDCATYLLLTAVFTVYKEAEMGDEEDILTLITEALKRTHPTITAIVTEEDAKIH